MSDRAALIGAVLDHPADDTPRLVFADWLEENDQPERAEFIRVQIELAKLPKAQRDASKPGKRAAALLKKHKAAWQAALGLESYEEQFRRGFFADVRVYSK